MTVFAAVVMTMCGTAAAQEKRYLIIHADDAGMSHSVNMATIEAMENGLVTSASIMVPCPWFPEFAKYAKEHPEKCFGIHLTLNSEWNYYRWGPVAPREQVPSLVDPDGFLWDNVGQVAVHAKAEEVRTELQAQIDRALAFGVPLSHLDTHMGALFSRPDLIEVYVQLGEKYNLPILYPRGLSEEQQREYRHVAARQADVVRRMTARGFPMLDDVLQFYDGASHEQRRATYLDAIRGLKPGLTELIVHCGYDNDELRAITNSSSRRDGDRRVFTEEAVRQLLADQQIELTNWKQLRATKAAKP